MDADPIVPGRHQCCTRSEVCMESEKERSRFGRFTDALYQIVFWFSAVLMAAMVFTIFIQVIARYVFSNSLTWSEEVGRYVFVMMTFYGGALGVKRNQHALLDSLVNLFPFKVAKMVNLISYSLMLGLTITVLIGLKAIMGVAKRQVSAALQLPMIYIYILMFIGMAVMMIFIIEKIVETAQLKENA